MKTILLAMWTSGMSAPEFKSMRILHVLRVKKRLVSFGLPSLSWHAVASTNCEPAGGGAEQNIIIFKYWFEPAYCYPGHNCNTRFRRHYATISPLSPRLSLQLIERAFTYRQVLRWENMPSETGRVSRQGCPASFRLDSLGSFLAFFLAVQYRDHNKRWAPRSKHRRWVRRAATLSFLTDGSTKWPRFKALLFCAFCVNIDFCNTGPILQLGNTLGKKNYKNTRPFFDTTFATFIVKKSRDSYALRATVAHAHHRCRDNSPVIEVFKISK